MRRFARLWRFVDRDLQGDMRIAGQGSGIVLVFIPSAIIMMIAMPAPKVAPWLIVVSLVLATLTGLAFIGWRAARLNKAARLKLDRAFARRDREILARQRADAK